MACACKNKKAGQVTAVKQVAKKVSISQPVAATTSTASNGSATTSRKSIVKRIMFKRH